jgi:hypothetical protein
MKKRNKLGQFYLITAIVIVAGIMGFATISNYSQKNTIATVYDIGEELQVESTRVLNQGIIGEDVDLSALLEGFIDAYEETYGDTGELENLVFIFGNLERITVKRYQNKLDMQVKIGEGNIEDLYDENSKEYNLDGKTKVTIIIGGIEYPFEIKEGENFYFVLYQETEEGEEYVYT